MHIKSKYILSLLLLASLLLACTNKGNKASDSDNNTQLNIGVMSSMDYFPIAVAKEKGFFEQEGVSVTINKFYSANERDAAFQSRNLDGTILDYTGAAIQRAGGIDLKLTSQCNGSFVLVAAKESEINSVYDLKGKRLAVSRNTVIDFCTDWVLQEANIALSDVNKVEINKIPLRLEMLRNGRIDATMLPDPFVTIALEGGNRKVIDIKDMDLRVTGIVFHDDVIAEKEAAIKSFYRAYNLAIELINTQPSSSFEDLLIAEIGVPAELVSKIELPTFTKAQLPQEKDLQKVEQWLKEKELVTADFDISTLIAASLLP
jgi:NitT/TauT family transport system substrate-binding protein